MATSSKNEPDVVGEVVSSFEDLPILSRLQFVRNALCARLDEEIEPGIRLVPKDPGPPLSLMIANGVLEEVIRELKGASGIPLVDPQGPTG